MKAAGAPAADIFRISAPPKFAFNVVIHEEEVPKVLFIPESAARPIIEAFDAGFKEDINTSIRSAPSLGPSATRKRTDEPCITLRLMHGYARDRSSPATTSKPASRRS